MNLGAPGIYCYGPGKKSLALWPQLGGKWENFKQSAINHRFRGMLPVFPGDLTLTTGTWHCHFSHKTQRPESIWSDKRGDLLSSYPATSAASKRLLVRLGMPDDDNLCDRACITFRRIEHHDEQCIEEAIRSFSSASASSASVGAVLRVVGHMTSQSHQSPQSPKPQRSS